MMRLLLWVLIGFLLGPVALSMAYPSWLATLSYISGCIYLLLAGLEVHFPVSDSRTFSQNLLKYLWPIGLPFLAGLLFFNSVIIGLALAITALPVIIQILKEKGLFNSVLGIDVISIASFCDLLVWVAVLVLLPIADAKIWFSSHLPVFLFFVGFSLSSLKRSSVFDKVSGTRLWTVLAVSLTKASNQVFAPLFFVGMGWGLKEALVLDWPFLINILIVGLVSKLLGGWLAGRALGYSSKDAFHLGVLVNVRGAMEIVAAQFIYKAQLIDGKTFSALIVLSFVTTVLAYPFIPSPSNVEDKIER